MLRNWGALNENTSGFDYETKNSNCTILQIDKIKWYFLLNSCKFAEINIKVKIR